MKVNVKRRISLWGVVKAELYADDKKICTIYESTHTVEIPDDAKEIYILQERWNGERQRVDCQVQLMLPVLKPVNTITF